MKRDRFFQQFCKTLELEARNMRNWLAMDVQETILMIQNTWEITAHQHTYIREVDA